MGLADWHADGLFVDFRDLAADADLAVAEVGEEVGKSADETMWRFVNHNGAGFFGEGFE